MIFITLKNCITAFGAEVPYWMRHHCTYLAKTRIHEVTRIIVFWVTFLVKCAYYTKNVIMYLKILISKANGLVFVHPDSQKAVKFYCNKVLDTYSLIRSLACVMLTIMSSAIWSELSNLRVPPSKWQKCHLEHQTLFIHIREGCNETTLEVHFDRLHCAWFSLQEQFSLKIVYVYYRVQHSC